MQSFKEDKAVYQRKETGHGDHKNIFANGIYCISWGKFAALYFRLWLVSLCSTFLPYFINYRVIEGNLT
jgi:hypothetical protein